MNDSKLTIISASLDRNWPKRLINDLSGINFPISIIIKILDENSNFIIRYCGNIEIKIIYGPDSGIYDALNQCILHIKSNYYVVIGDDDNFYVDILNKIIPKILDRSDSKDIYIFKSYNRKLNIISSYHSTSYFIKTNLHSKYGLYSTCFKIASDFYFLSMHEYSSEKVNLVIGEYGGNGLSSCGLRLHIEHRIVQLLSIIRKLKLFFFK